MDWSHLRKTLLPHSPHASLIYCVYRAPYLMMALMTAVINGTDWAGRTLARNLDDKKFIAFTISPDLRDAWCHGKRTLRE